MEIEQNRHQSNPVAHSRRHQRVEVEEHLLVEAGRKPVRVETDARPAVAQDEDPNERETVGGDEP